MSVLSWMRFPKRRNVGGDASKISSSGTFPVATWRAGSLPSRYTNSKFACELSRLAFSARCAWPS